MPHSNDANTFALWRMDEVAAAVATLADDAGVYPLTVSGFLDHTAGPGGARYARHCDGTSSNYASGAGDAAAAAALILDRTVEAWVKLDDLSIQHQIVVYGANSETEANNTLISLSIKTNGYLECYWESGAGVDRITAQTTGTAVTAGVWTHVAFSISVGATSTVKFYVGGVLQQTVTSVTNATGGTTSQWFLYRNPVGIVSCIASVRDIHVSKVVRNDAYIAADAAASDYLHIKDSYTLALWRFAEAPDLIDETTNGRHLRWSTGTQYIVPVHSNNGRYYDATAGRASGLTSSAWLTLLQGEWSWEGWIQVGDSNTTQIGLFHYGSTGSEAQDRNVQLSLVVTSTRTLVVFWENGAGTDVTFTTAALFSAVNALKLHHLAVTCTNTGGSNRVVRVYLDGVLFQTSGTLTAPDGGTNAVMKLELGSGNYSAANVDWYGRLDDVRISNIPRTADEILASAAIPSGGRGRLGSGWNS